MPIFYLPACRLLEKKPEILITYILPTLGSALTLQSRKKNRERMAYQSVKSVTKCLPFPADSCKLRLFITL